MKITDLSFKYKQFDDHGELIERELFYNLRIMRSIALYIKFDKKYRDGGEIEDPLFYCFNDCWAKCEYEVVLSPWVGEGEPTKQSVYDLYIKPNKELFMGMVNSVSKNSAIKYLREHKR